MRRGVVVTGVGLVCAGGDSSAALQSTLRAGQPVFHPPTAVACDSVAGRVVAEVRDFQPARYLGPGNLRPLDRTGQLATVAVHNALADSGWTEARSDTDEIGVVLGTMFGGLKTIAEFDRRALRDGPEYASPLDFANTVINAAAGQVAIWHRLRGVNTTIAAGAAAGLHAIGYAAQMIQTGRADVLLAGGAEEICFESFLGFERAGWLAGPEAAGRGPRPFGREATGWVLAEGAAFLVLEDETRARARGARTLGFVSGFGAGLDRRSVSQELSPTGGLPATIQAAMADARVPAGMLAFVSAAAGGFPMLDRLEADALTGLGVSAPVAVPKAVLGEACGASGALQAIAALEALRTGELPGAPAVDVIPEAARLDLVADGRPRRIHGSHALVTAFAPEGTCCALVLSTPSPP